MTQGTPGRWETATHPDCCEDILKFVDEGDQSRVVDINSAIVSSVNELSRSGRGKQETHEAGDAITGAKEIGSTSKTEGLERGFAALFECTEPDF